MKYPDNIDEIVRLNPDYIGFIFYPKSPRYVVSGFDFKSLDVIPSSIKKVGVFVNEDFENLLKMANVFRLDMIQLHGNESPEYCINVKQFFPVIKAFHVSDKFGLAELESYEDKVDYFLFDTKTPKYGGSGEKFNWEMLKSYASQTPYFLSGGIGPDDIQTIIEMNLKGCYAVDINSRVEIEPGLKDKELIKVFRQYLKDKVSH